MDIRTRTHVILRTTAVLIDRGPISGKTEVGQVDLRAVRVGEDILGFEVPVEDACLMARLHGVDEGQKRLPKAPVLVREDLLLAYRLEQVAAPAEIQDNEEVLEVFERVVDADDVRVAGDHAVQRDLPAHGLEFGELPAGLADNLDGAVEVQEVCPGMQVDGLVDDTV